MTETVFRGLDEKREVLRCPLQSVESFGKDSVTCSLKSPCNINNWVEFFGIGNSVSLTLELFDRLDNFARLRSCERPSNYFLANSVKFLGDKTQRTPISNFPHADLQTFRFPNIIINDRFDFCQFNQNVKNYLLVERKFRTDFYLTGEKFGCLSNISKSHSHKISCVRGLVPMPKRSGTSTAAANLSQTQKANSSLNITANVNSSKLQPASSTLSLASNKKIKTEHKTGT